MERMTVIDGVARVVVEAEQEHVVELSRPEVSVVVEVVNKITGVCVVGDSQYVEKRREEGKRETTLRRAM